MVAEGGAEVVEFVEGVVGELPADGLDEELGNAAGEFEPSGPTAFESDDRPVVGLAVGVPEEGVAPPPIAPTSLHSHTSG